MSKNGKRTRDLRNELKELQGPLEPKEALAYVRKGVSSAFDEAIELHVNLGIDLSKSEHIVRGTVTLPHGTGIEKRIACFCEDEEQAAVKEAGATIVGGEELIKQIQTTEKTDFDVAIATPGMMRHVGKIGKILGMRGLMPNPKNETVTKTPAKTIQELLGGKVTFRNDDGGNLHQVVGRASFTDEQLAENIETFIAEVRRTKPDGLKGVFLKKITLTSSMGPGVPVRVG